MNQTKINKLIDVALPVAMNIPRKKRHVSLIVRRGAVVSFGTNSFKTHPLAARIGYRFEEMHSELDALTKYKGPKDSLVLFNFRFNRVGELRMSKPCCLCLPWCEAVFDKIYHSMVDGFVEHSYSKNEKGEKNGICNWR